MRIARFDHVAIPTSDIVAMAAFYAALGFEAPDVAEWQGDPPPFCSLRFGDNMINLHGPEMWRDGNLTLRGPTASPGCGDLCFVWEGGIQSLLVMLEQAGVEIEEGPVERIGGRSAGTTPGTSVYIRDPDKNLLEFIVYED